MGYLQFSFLRTMHSGTYGSTFFFLPKLMAPLEPRWPALYFFLLNSKGPWVSLCTIVTPTFSCIALLKEINKRNPKYQLLEEIHKSTNQRGERSPTSAFCLGDTRQQMTEAQSTASPKKWSFISSSKVYAKVFPSIINANAACGSFSSFIICEALIIWFKMLSLMAWGSTRTRSEIN